jgi:hypothetical protein
MEKKIAFELSQKSALYLCKHFIKLSSFEQTQLEKSFSFDQINCLTKEIGSKFFSEFTDGPFSLISALNKISPYKVNFQTNGREAYIFQFEQNIGISNVVKLSQIHKKHQEKLKKTLRGDYEVWAFKTNEKIETNQIVLISEGNKVITCFPGLFAPPLPTKEMHETIRKESLEFWNTHAFIEYEE